MEVKFVEILFLISFIFRFIITLNPRDFNPDPEMFDVLMHVAYQKRCYSKSILESS